MQDGKMAARGGRDLPSRARRDAPWRTQRRWSSTRTSERAPPRRRGRSRTRPSCLCTHGRDGVRRGDLLRALSSRVKRDAPLAWPYRSSRLVRAIHLGVRVETAKRFRRRGFLNPERRVETEPQKVSVSRRSRTRRPLRKFRKFFLVPPMYPFKRSRETGFGEPRVMNSFAPACGPTPQHRRTGPHRRTSHNGEEEH